MSEAVVSWEEFEKHIYSYDCWVMVEQRVYNVSDFLVEHPGGDDVLVKFSGRDATPNFNSLPHSDYAVSLRNARLVGKIESPQPPEGYLDRIANKKKQSQQSTKRTLAKRSDPISREEVALHKSQENCWIVLQGKVYDVTSYLEEHPGGVNKIMEWAGADGSKAFAEVKHSITALQKGEEYLIGEVEKKRSPMALVLALLAVALGVYLVMNAL